MKHVFLVFLLFLTFVLQVNVASSQELDDKIVYHTFNGEFAKADSLITAALHLTPGHPKYYYLKASLCFYDRLFRSSGLDNRELLQLVAENAQKAIDLAETQEKTTENKFYLGASYDFLCRAKFLLERSVFDGYSGARQSKKYLEQVIEENPKLYDAYLSLAVLEYFASTRLNSWWQEFVAWISGMSGEKENAMEYFQLVEEKGRLRKAEAQFILAMLHRFIETDLDKASGYITGFIAKYPQNVFMANTHKQMQFDQLIDEKGIAFLQTNIDSLSSHYAINNPGILNRVGYNFVNKEDFESAIAVFQLNINLYPGVANCYDSMGEAYLLAGDNHKAVTYYQMALEKVETDTTINDTRREFLRENIKTQLGDLDAT